MLRFGIIVAFVVGMAILYGIAHDMVTAHLCVEYFTIGHPKIIRSEEPVMLALAWGFWATWWAGLILGLGLAWAARVGSRPKRDIHTLVKPVVILLGIMAVFAFGSGCIGFLLARLGKIVLAPEAQANLPREIWPRFQACWFAHSMSYYVGFVGGGMQIAWVWVMRKRQTRRGH